MSVYFGQAKALFKQVLKKGKRKKKEVLGRQHRQHEFPEMTSVAMLPRPELGDDTGIQMANLSISTAEIAANAPRYRRRSSTFIDAIHDVSDNQNLAPAQLYSTMSGRLFHSGRIAIVMVGLPARGKT